MSSKDINEKHAVHSKRWNYWISYLLTLSKVSNRFGRILEKSDFVILCLIMLVDCISSVIGYVYIMADDTYGIKNKKPTRNLKNRDDKCFQYAIIVTPTHETKFKKTHKKYQTGSPS